MTIKIDGAMGEGGGQVLRSSLTLSVITGEPVHLVNIRAGRTNPGLRPQHMRSVEAAAAICEGNVRGLAAGSQDLVFTPGPISAGKYQFEVGTAGSASLVLQTIFLPLSRASKASSVRIRGGTHVPWSPSFHYLALQWLPFMAKMGYRAHLEMPSAGFYPPGGGVIEAAIRPAKERLPVEVVERGEFQRIRGIAGISNLDQDIAHRMKQRALDRLEPQWRDSKIQVQTFPAISPGAFLLLAAEFEKSQCVYCALGEKGKRAEVVADEACSAMEAFIERDGAIDEFLADQLLLPCALASGPSVFRTVSISQHLLTNADVIRLFLPVQIEINGNVGDAGNVKVLPL